MAGEVGVIKKDIIYSGDVLNTTARIQEQCNHYSVDILLSKETFDLISDTDGFKLMPLGNIELRGKKTKIELNTIVTI
jgi:adenylate cyclase